MEHLKLQLQMRQLQGPLTTPWWHLTQHKQQRILEQQRLYVTLAEQELIPGVNNN